MADFIAAAFILGGCFFFLAGTVGLLRFPDTLSRLHALTKADNLGLGLVAAGVAVHGGDLVIALKLLVVWVAALAASATVALLIGRAMVERDEP
ncbi:MAG: monovalent cation/H(+) antiporter subunit G [Alphaproteobacteria bacterium]|nr:monovalent cation/H(+) antiporter subunit G [Alphaproteobacteria bacterium]